MIHLPPVPRASTPWSEAYVQGGPNEPHRWSATKRTASGVVVHEVEFHNAGIRRGQRARGEFPCTVTVEAPPGWVLVADCQRPLPSVWYPMHGAMRRFAMYPANKPHLKAEAEVEARMPYDAMRWARGVNAYGPCNLPMPKLTAQQAAQESNKIIGWLSRYRQLISTPGARGSVEDAEEGIFDPVNGWTPLGINKRGQEGGSGIFFYDGWEQSPLSPAYHWIKACCAHERNWHAYDLDTGAIVTAEFYGDPGPMYQQETNDPNNGWLPEFKGYLDPISATIDPAHGPRQWSDLVPLSEMTDSPAVKRMLRSVAAQHRLQLSEIGPRPTSNYTPPSLRTYRDWAKSAPHTGHFGMDTGRQHGWRAYIIAQSVKKAGATENIPWCDMYAEFSDLASMPTGIISRCAINPPNPANVWYDPDHDLAHAFEVPIEKYGAVGCSLASGRQLSNPLRFAEALYLEAPLLPYYSGKGPPQYAWVAKRGGAPYPKITGGKGNTGDSTHVHAGCALAASLDPANRKKWIDAALRIEPISDFRKDAGLVGQMQLL